MNKLILALLMTCVSYPLFAATPQEKMKTCNADATAKSLKGDERKAFMKTCLSNKPESGLTAQQNKMKTRNADAATNAWKGDERKAFMKTCLSAS